MKSSVILLIGNVAHRGAGALTSSSYMMSYAACMTPSMDAEAARLRIFTNTIGRIFSPTCRWIAVLPGSEQEPSRALMNCTGNFLRSSGLESGGVRS